jgi:hypothetical protein
MKGLVQGLDVVFMGKAHVFPYDIAAYKQNRYLVDPLWRGVTVRTRAHFVCSVVSTSSGIPRMRAQFQRLRSGVQIQQQVAHAAPGPHRRADSQRWRRSSGGTC